MSARPANTPTYFLNEVVAAAGKPHLRFDRRFYQIPTAVAVILTLFPRSRSSPSAVVAFSLRSRRRHFERPVCRGPTRDQFFRYTPVIRFSRFERRERAPSSSSSRHCLSRTLSCLFSPSFFSSSADRRRQKKARRAKREAARGQGPSAHGRVCVWRGDCVCVRNTRTYTKMSNRLGLADGTVADTHAFPRIHAMSTKNIHARQRARNR